MTLIVHDVPAPVLKDLAGQLRSYGATVDFDDELSGSIRHVSGEMEFAHDGEGALTIALTRSCGHFSELMLKGGIRQLVEEAVEDWRREAVPA